MSEKQLARIPAPDKIKSIKPRSTKTGTLGVMD